MWEGSDEGGHSYVIVVSCQWMCARVRMCVLYTTTGLYSNIPLHLWADQAELSLLYTSKRGESSTCFMRPLESAAQWVLRISTGAAWRPAAPYNNRAVVTSAVLAHTLKTIAKANKQISKAHQNKWKRRRRGEGGGAKQWPHPKVGIFCIHTTTGGACPKVMVTRQSHELWDNCIIFFNWMNSATRVCLS